jgi:hypothetical protein
MAGLDPAIGYPHQLANDAIPVTNHPMEMGRVKSSHDVVACGTSTIRATGISRACARPAHAFSPSRYVLISVPGRFNTLQPSREYSSI